MVHFHIILLNIKQNIPTQVIATTFSFTPLRHFYNCLVVYNSQSRVSGCVFKSQNYKFSRYIEYFIISYMNIWMHRYFLPHSQIRHKYETHVPLVTKSNDFCNSISVIHNPYLWIRIQHSPLFVTAASLSRLL